MVGHQNFVLHQLQLQEPASAPTAATATAGATTPVPYLGTWACNSPLDATKEAIRNNWRYLQNVNLQESDLQMTPLYEADLGHATLKGAHLEGASLRCANLAEADLNSIKFNDRTDLRLVNLKGAIVDDSLKQMISGEKIATLSLDDKDWHTWAVSGFSGKILREFVSGAASESNTLALAGGDWEHVAAICKSGHFR